MPDIHGFVKLQLKVFAFHNNYIIVLLFLCNFAVNYNNIIIVDSVIIDILVVVVVMALMCKLCIILIIFIIFVVVIIIYIYMYKHEYI